MSTGRPVITGVGLCTVLGQDSASTWDALLAGRRVVEHTPIEIDTTTHGSRVLALASRVVHQAITDAKWDAKTLADDRTALIVATSKGEIESWIDASPAAQRSRSNKPLDENLIIPPAGRSHDRWGVGSLADPIAKELKLGDGPRMTLSAACASGLHALIRGCMMLQCEPIDRVLVVAAEASVHPLFIESFRRLGVLAPPGFGCKPFDANRSGFVMTEAGAAICLERPSSKTAYASVDRYALAGDAHHLTAADSSGSVLRRTLSDVIAGKSVDFVHAHGTGTVVNDPSELNAIDETLGFLTTEEDRNVPVYSHKGNLGHTLGAAGLVSVVLSCLMHQRQTVPAIPALNDPLPAKNCRVAAIPTERHIKRSINLAAGFGGATAVVALESTTT